MKQIVELTADPHQKHTIIQENGESFTLELNYYPSQEAWYYNITKGSFIANGNRIVLSPNTLRTYRNNINFGLGILASDRVEPFQIDDFSEQRVQMFLLTADEVEEVETSIYES